jgi:WD40 repeat protein
LKQYYVSASDLYLLNNEIAAHKALLCGLAFSPNQERVAAGYKSGKVIIWELASGEPIYTLSEHNDFVQGVRFSRDGEILASVSDDSYLILWNITETPPSIVSKTPAHRGAICDVVFSHDGDNVITGGADDQINVRDITDPEYPKLIFTLNGFTDRVQSLAPMNRMRISPPAGRIILCAFLPWTRMNWCGRRIPGSPDR